ncbi:MAG TPA: lipid-A-disaccharide synthase [Terracidiphilus sp.]|jgi:lipid-A-disaccharide synthase
MTPGIFISAGEASGEAYGALLIEELRCRLAEHSQQADFWGMGGPRMAAAGLDRVVRAEDMAVMGITEVVRHLPRIYREFRRLKQAIRDRRPAVAVLIDFPDIHFKLAEQLRTLGIPVVFFVSPQLWAWKKHRIKLVQKYVDRMLVIFPFEEPFYRQRGVNAEFVGHPLAELPLPSIGREEFARQNGLDSDQTWIGLLPGSRAKEIRDNLPEMLAAANVLAEHDFSRAVQPVNQGFAALAPEGRLHFLLPLAPTLTPEKQAWVRHFVHGLAPGLPVTLVDDARAALHHARASIVASGTATVEAALIGSPFVVVYRVSPLTYAIAKRVVTVPHVAMVNLIARKRLIPELIQNDFTASNIVREIMPLLPDGPPRQSMMKELAELRGQLRSGIATESQPVQGAIGRVAEVTLDLLGKARPVE